MLPVLVEKSLTTVSLRKEVFVIWATKRIRISEILVTKWAQASIVLWTVSATWNTNSQIAAVTSRRANRKSSGSCLEDRYYNASLVI
jgi:hypothetical protein